MSRDEGTFQVSARLRLLARTAAFTLAILLAFQVAEWIKSPLRPFTNLIGALADIANILLLAALARDPGDKPEENPPVSTLLYVVTKVTVITWGVWVAFNLLRVLLLPYAYSQTRDYLLIIGSYRPVFLDMAREVVTAFLSQACLWVAPFIVYRTRVRNSPAPPDTSPASPDPQNPPPS